MQCWAVFFRDVLSSLIWIATGFPESFEEYCKILPSVSWTVTDMLSNQGNAIKQSEHIPCKHESSNMLISVLVFSYRMSREALEWNLGLGRGVRSCYTWPPWGHVVVQQCLHRCHKIRLFVFFLSSHEGLFLVLFRLMFAFNPFCDRVFTHQCVFIYHLVSQLSNGGELRGNICL